MIPEDWEVRKLGEVALDISSGKSKIKHEQGSYKVYGSTGVIGFNNFYDYQGEKILIARVGANAGKVNLVNGKYCVSDNTLIISYKADADILFSYYQLVNYKLNRLIFGSGQPLITGGQLKNLYLSFPPLPEQKAIAKVLSDVDELITSIEELIDKKQKIKQGTMQLLLTGKKRLPGFTGEWEVKKLGEIGTTYSGLTGKRKADFVDGKYPYITFLNVINNTVINEKEFDYVNLQKNENQNLAMKGDLFFNTSSETPEEVGMCSVLIKNISNLYLNSFCFGYRLSEDAQCCPLFLAYYFRSDKGRKIFFSLAQGSTRYNLSKKNFNKLEILCPPYPEQKAIAQILSDMDLEIEALEEKLNKYKHIKEGMMEQLLTGKVRLI